MGKSIKQTDVTDGKLLNLKKKPPASSIATYALTVYKISNQELQAIHNTIYKLRFQSSFLFPWITTYLFGFFYYSLGLPVYGYINTVTVQVSEKKLDSNYFSFGLQFIISNNISKFEKHCWTVLKLLHSNDTMCHFQMYQGS